MTLQATNSTISGLTAAKELLAVGPNVKDIDILLKGLARPVDILRLTHDRNPLEQIADALKNRKETEVLHLLAHGEPGAIHLGGEPFDLAGIYKNEGHVNGIRDALAGKAKVALWACSVAWMEAGERFIEALTEKFCATVFASDRPVGAENLGGDWRIGTASPFMKSTEAAYPHTLGTFDFETASNDGSKTVVQTVNGVKMTITSSTNIQPNNLSNFGGTTGQVLYTPSQASSLTVTFDTAIEITSLQLLNPFVNNNSDSYIFSVVSGNGTAITVNPGDLANDGGRYWKKVDFSDWTNVTSFSVTAGDGAAYMVLDSIVFVGGNAAPTVTGLVNDVSFTEDTEGNLDLSASDFNDTDDTGGAAVVKLRASEGTLTADAVSGFTITGTGTSEVSISYASFAGIDTYLNTAGLVKYTGSSNDTGNDTATITVIANDGDGSGDVTVGTVNVDISAVNDSPSFSNLNATPSFTEGGAAVQLDADMAIVDPELDGLNSGNGDYTGASFTIARNGGVNAEDIFSVATGGNLTVAGGPNGGGTFTAGGNVIANIADVTDDDELQIAFVNNGTIPTTALVNEVLQAVRYSNSNVTANGNVQLSWGFSDGNSGDTQGTGDNPGQGAGSSTVGLVNVNAAPSLSGSAGTVAFTEDGSAVVVDNGITITDTDNTTFASATVDIGAGHETTDVLALGASSGIGNIVAGAYDSNTGTLTLASAGSTATLAEWQTALQSVTFGSTSQNPTVNREVTFTINDGTDNSAGVSRTVTVTGQNDAPTISGTPSPSVLMQTATDLNLSALTVGDVDSTNLTARVHVNSGTLAADSAGGAHAGGANVTASSANRLVVTGTATQINAFLDDTDEVAFTSANNTNDVTLSVSIDDSNHAVVNDTPGTISVVDGDVPMGTTTSYNGTEDTPVTLDTVGMAAQQEAAANDALNYITITGVTGGTLALGAGAQTHAADGTTATAAVGPVTAGALINPVDIGRVTFTPTADSTTAATITYTVTDQGPDTSPSATLTINLAAVQDAPTAANSAVTLNEDTSYTFKAADFNFADVDSGDTLTQVHIGAVNTAAGDTLQFNNVEVTGKEVIAVGDLSNLVYTPAANANGAARSTFTFSVHDGTTGSASDYTLTLNVTDVPEAVVVVTPPTTTQPEPIVVRADDDPNGNSDSLSGAALNDTIEAGGGNDSVSGGDGQDSLLGGAGNDGIDGGNDNDFIDAGTGDDTIQGGEGQDSLFGGAGNDTVQGGTGNDLVKAGADDTGNDSLSGDEGDDTLGGGAGGDSVEGGVGSDLLWGREGNDVLDGGDGNDLIFNGEGDDTVMGGAGSDLLWASPGDDLLSGGEGQDTFVFGKKSGADSISDFEVNSDTLDLRFSVTDFNDVSDVQAAATASTQGGVSGVLIALGGENSVFIAGLSVDDLVNVNFNL